MAFRNDLVNVAKAEWDFFDRDEAGEDHTIGKVKKEAYGKYNRRVADYWKAIPEKQYKRLKDRYATRQTEIDGTTPLAWSAAFISYCMKKAGAESHFPYSSGHATWIHASIRNRKKKKMDADLVGFRPGELPLEVGDIVGYWRGKTKTSYDQAATKGWFESHSDIVVAVDKAKRVAYTIGGNVSQSVARKKLAISAKGALVDPPSKCIVHIKNNIE